MNDTDRAILDFEHRQFRYSGTKESAIREAFGISATRYYQRLNALLDSPEAYKADPMLVKRLRRLREQRRSRRSA